MTTPRETDLTKRLSALLDRLSPPRSIAANTDAQRAEAAALLRSILAAAPSQGWADWWGKFEDALLRRLKTRAWPILSEVDAAARDIATASRGENANASLNESHAIRRMVDWFGKFKNQMPGHGRASRTRAMIESGVLRNEREAKFYGFDLSADMLETAKNQPQGREESDHHERVLSDIHAINRRIEDNKAQWREQKGAA